MYRCAGCRAYYRTAPYRTIGLSRICSPNCEQIMRHAGDIPRDTRAAVLERDQHRCRYCGTTQNLHLHHINYRSQGIDHSESNLITLCADHHALVHADKHKWQPILADHIANANASQYLRDI